LRPYLLSALRIAVALSFLTHGTQKLFSWPVNQARPIADILTQTWFAAVLETFGGLLMLLGLFTRPVGFILSGQMAVAYFQAHWPRGFWPILNGAANTKNPHDAYASDRTIDSHVKRMRRKLGETEAGFDPIETVYGLGYRLREL
jgi:uncharacterized membrane protein YphA (DoxX/SURF4 family)